MHNNLSLIAAPYIRPIVATVADPRILGVGTMTTPISYSQTEILSRFGIEDRRIRSVFLNSGIDRRFLDLPTASEDGRFTSETQSDLLEKHRRQGVAIGAGAIAKCLAHIGADYKDIAYLCCVTTTGFLSPGLTARICKEMRLNQNCVRLDVVGMGCNAGLNALNAASSWSQSNPGQLGILLCVEICSAGYVLDMTMRTSVVNSLFGDGAAAVAFRSGYHGAALSGPSILRFNSHIILDAVDAMRYDWDEAQGKFSFYLDPDIPYVIGANVESTILGLLDRTGIGQSDVQHWIVHSGGKKVIDAVRVNLGLSPYDLRHTSSVLRDYGNLSSGSFLFSYEQLLAERLPVPGDYGVMMTMGPGSSIETALLQF